MCQEGCHENQSYASEDNTITSHTGGDTNLLDLHFPEQHFRRDYGNSVHNLCTGRNCQPSVRLVHRWAMSGDIDCCVYALFTSAHLGLVDHEALIYPIADRPYNSFIVVLQNKYGAYLKPVYLSWRGGSLMSQQIEDPVKM